MRYAKDRMDVAQKAKEPHSMPTGLSKAPPPLSRLMVRRTMNTAVIMPTYRTHTRMDGCMDG